MAHPAMKASVLVLGIGSPVVCDDAIGFRVIDQLRKKGPAGCGHRGGHAQSGLDLIEIMLDYKKVIVVDAILIRPVPGRQGHGPGRGLALQPPCMGSTLTRPMSAPPWSWGGQLGAGAHAQGGLVRRGRGQRCLDRERHDDARGGGGRSRGGPDGDRPHRGKEV